MELTDELYIQIVSELEEGDFTPKQENIKRRLKNTNLL